MLGGERREALQQASPDSAALRIVSDRERGLRRRRVTEAVVFTHRHDSLLASGVRERADEDAAFAPVGVDEMFDELVVDRARSVEAQVEAVLREPAEELCKGVGVRAPGRPQTERRAVAQDNVDGVQVGCRGRSGLLG